MTLRADGCRRARRLLAARPDGDLATTELHALEQHLFDCEECRAYGAQIDGAVDALREFPASIPFPADALEQVWDRTLRRPRGTNVARAGAARASFPLVPRRRWGPAAWTAAAAAAVLLAAIVGPYLALRGSAPSTPPAAVTVLSPEERRAAADLKRVLMLTDRALDRSRHAAIEGVIRRGVDPALRRVPVLRDFVAGSHDADGSGGVLR